MLEVYWGCLIGGLAFGLISLIFGDFLGDAFDGLLDAISIDGFDFLHPMTLVSAITVFGGAGIMLTKYSSLETITVGLLAGAGAILFAILLFFIYVKPMKKSESSIGYSIKELVGRPGEVTIPIPENGYGEVEIKFGSQRTYHIAAAYDNIEIPSEKKIVVVEVRDRTVYVTADV